MDLFEYAKSKTLDRESPLASRLRPTTLGSGRSGAYRRQRQIIIPCYQGR